MKARLYAKAGIREYWIVNINGRCIEVRRDPGGRISGRHDLSLLASRSTPSPSPTSRSPSPGSSPTDSTEPRRDLDPCGSSASCPR